MRYAHASAELEQDSAEVSVTRFSGGEERCYLGRLSMRADELQPVDVEIGRAGREL